MTDHGCSFCKLGGQFYQGGLEYKDVKVEGSFCSSTCFKKWVNWKIALIDFQLKSMVST